MTAPLRWPERPGGVRRFLLDRLPFHIRYRVTAGTVPFLGILHGARHPDTGAGRT